MHDLSHSCRQSETAFTKSHSCFTVRDCTAKRKCLVEISPWLGCWVLEVKDLEIIDLGYEMPRAVSGGPWSLHLRLCVEWQPTCTTYVHDQLVIEKCWHRILMSNINTAYRCFMFAGRLQRLRWELLVRLSVARVRCRHGPTGQPSEGPWNGQRRRQHRLLTHKTCRFHKLFILVCESGDVAK